MVVGAIILDIEVEVRQAQAADPDPGTGPLNRRYVPAAARSKVLTWLHTAKFSCHPGVNRMLSLLKRHFWWPNRYQDVKSFVGACCVCAQNKCP